MSTQSSPATALTPHRAGWTLVAVAIGFIMATLDVTIVNVALAELERRLAFGLGGLAWIVDGYTLTFAAFLLAGGALANRLGAKTAYLNGLGLFLVASLLCGLSETPGMLIAARLLQGFGAALFMPSSLTLLVAAFPHPARRARAIGLWAALVSIASGLGPFVGGVLVEHWGWRSIFLINLPIGLVGLVLTVWAVTPAPKKDADLNPATHLFGVLSLGGLCFALIEGPDYGWLSMTVLGAAGLAVFAALGFTWRERVARHPVLPAALFRHPGFLAANGIGFLLNFATFGIVFLLSLYFQQGQGDSPQTAGLRLLPMMAMFALANLMAGKLGGRWSSLTLLRAALPLAALSVLPLLVVGAGSTPYALLAVCISLTNIGVGLAVPAMTNLVMQRAGQTHANIASAALNANRQIGALFGVAALAVVLQHHSDWAQSLQAGVALLFVSHALASVLAWIWAGRT